MEVGEKTSKRGFAVNRCIEFTLGTRYVYVKKRQLPVTFNLRGEYRGERFARRKTNSCYKYDGPTYNF